MSQSNTAGHKRYALRSADRSSTSIPLPNSVSRAPEIQRTPTSRPSSGRHPLSASTWQAAQSPGAPSSLRRQTSTHSGVLLPRTSPATVLDLSLPLKDLKYRDLAFACRQRGLRARGKKTELIQRLIDDGYAGSGLAKKIIAPDDKQYDHEGSLTATTSITQSRNSTPARTRRIRAGLDAEGKKSAQIGSHKVDNPLKLRRKLRSSARVVRNSAATPRRNTRELIHANTLKQEGEATQQLESYQRFPVPQQAQARTKGRLPEPNLVVPPRTNSIAANSSVPRPFLPRRSLRLAQPVAPSLPASIPTTPTIPQQSVTTVPADEADQIALSSTSFQGAAPCAQNSTVMPLPITRPQTVPQQRLQTLQMLRKMCDRKANRQGKGQNTALSEPPTDTMNCAVERSTGGVAGLNLVRLDRDCGKEIPAKMAGLNNWQSKRIQGSKRPYEDLQDLAVGGLATERDNKIRKRSLEEKRTDSNAGLTVYNAPALPGSLPTSPRKNPLVFKDIATPERTLRVLLESSPTSKTKGQSPLTLGASIYSDRRKQRILSRAQSNVQPVIRARHSWLSDLRVKSLPTGDVVRGHTLLIERGTDWSDEGGKSTDFHQREELLRERMKNISEDLTIDSAKVGRTVSEVVRRSPFQGAPPARTKRNVIQRLFKNKRKRWL